MLRKRVIPVLLYRGGGLVKSVRFKDYTYVGDVINALRTFNEKEVDEIALLDIGATPEGRGPNYALVEETASECFMPLAYGGGISEANQLSVLFRLGVEKVILNTAVADHPELVSQAASLAGSQSIVVSIDVKQNWLGKYRVHVNGGRRDIGVDPVSYARKVESLGAGEILLNSIDKDGTMSGYDLELVKAVTQAVSIPVIACGGAGSLSDIKMVLSTSGASASAAGSLFVFYGKHRAVLITYPSPAELELIFNERN
jgi:imidazole glycerol-phosphate synthase subunit HisF